MNLHVQEVIRFLSLGAVGDGVYLRVWLSIKGGQRQAKWAEAGVHLESLYQQYWLLEVPKKGLAFGKGVFEVPV